MKTLRTLVLTLLLAVFTVGAAGVLVGCEEEPEAGAGVAADANAPAEDPNETADPNA